MTREELLEDANIGDKVKIYTESDEIFEGKIVDFGVSGMKISLIGSNKSKRISYKRISEYDVDENNESSNTKEYVEKDYKINTEVSVTAEVSESQEEINNINVFRNIKRDAIFKNITKEIDFEEIRKSLDEKYLEDNKSEVLRVRDMINYAKKINEYNLKSDRIKRAVTEYKKLSYDENNINAYIGLLYHELGDYKKASEYYDLADEYDLEFKTFFGPDENLFEIAILAVEYNDEDEVIIKWLCEYAVKNDNISIIKFLIDYSKKFQDDILLYWYCDKKEITLLPNKEQLYSQENIQYLRESCIKSSDSNSVIEDIVNNQKKEISIDDEDIQYGTISFYNKNGGNGMIKKSDGGSIYFYIKQVEDIELQRILATESNYKRKVTYIEGINFKGEIAADAIFLDEEYIKNANIQKEYTNDGFIESYDVYEEFGKIQSGDKSYNFIFNEIEDPLLYAKIFSNPFNNLEIEVKFNVRNHKSKKNKKTSKIACDIVSKNISSEEEINEFIELGMVTRQKVNEWLGIEDTRNITYFKEVEYEPLKPIKNDKYENIPFISNIHKSYEIKKNIQYKNNERKAISLIIPEGEKNFFASLPKKNVGKKYFQEAHRYTVGRKDIKGDIVGTNLDKAEELFIKAIQANDQTPSSVANLANIYVKNGGEYIKKGLLLLEEYGYLFPAEKLTNLRIQLIDKSGNYEALELILLYAIENSLKKNTVYQYMSKLAGIYYKQQKWQMAIEWSNKCLDYLDKHKREFSQYENLKKGNIRLLIISNYSSGNKEKAILQAKDYLKSISEDPIIESIVNNTFELDAIVNVIDDESEVEYEDEILNTENTEISQFLNSKLEEVNLGSKFSRVQIVYEKIQDGVYTGNGEDLEKAIRYIRKNKREKSAGDRSETSLSIARMISDSRKTSNSSEEKVSLNEVKKYIARYARYRADACVESYSKIDSIRFLYIQALKYLRADDSGNIYASMNMLIASFFVDSQRLPTELHDMKSSVYNDSYYKLSCVSIKDLLIATFMLQEKQNYVETILDNSYKEKQIRNDMIYRLSKIAGENKNIYTKYDFDLLWKNAKDIYYSNIEQLGKEIKESIIEYKMVGSISQRVQKIKGLLSLEILWNQDEHILKNYLKLILLISDTFAKYTVEEKIEGFNEVQKEIDKLKLCIERDPTEFSYEYIYTKLDDLRLNIIGEFNDLYLSSSPECNILLSNESVYVNENTVEIAITFKNAENKQDADAIEIKLKGSDGATFDHCEKKFSNIRSGEIQDCLAVFSLDNKVIKDGQFEVFVEMQYQYKESVENIKKQYISETLLVNIKDKEHFTPIDNNYDKIFRTSGVDIKTPELFKGRNDLINSICASMSSSDGVMTKNRGIILWGQRRVGKNSVKDYLKEKIRKEYPNAYIIIELGSIGKSRNIQEVLATIVNKTEDTLMLEYEEIYEALDNDGMVFDGCAIENADNCMPTFARFMDRFSTKLKKINNDKKNIPLYFIDEFSYLYEWIEEGKIDGKDFMRFWKSFIQDYGICSIIIAQDNIPVWKSRYENEFACMNYDNEITYLDFDGTKELICEPCQIEGKVLFTPDAVKLIYDWTKGSAYLIVIFCKHIIDYLNNNYIERATKTVVQLVFEKEFINEKGIFESGDFEPQIQDVANVGEEGEKINSLNEKLLEEIARETITSSHVKKSDLMFFKNCNENEITEKVFNRLKERKIIEVERGQFCSISMPLLKFYLLRKQSILSKEVLNKLSR